MKRIICLLKKHIWVEAVRTHTPLIMVFHCSRCDLWKEFIVQKEDQMDGFLMPKRHSF